MNVREYAERAFPHFELIRVCCHGDVEAFNSMPIDSNCGNDCKEAIDAAKKLVKKIHEAWGNDRPNYVSNVVEAAMRTCRIFITG